MAGNKLGKTGRRVNSCRTLNAKLRSFAFILKAKALNSDKAGLMILDELEMGGQGEALSSLALMGP